ncbi:MAG: ABC transporter ATP-binding protein [Acidobacteria bacterium]|nr:ABC transporter ATP-binding protein [Acidobacteriota bacterium]
MDVLTVTGARKAFGSVKALDGASFTLRQGELLALLGPNGAGKTTVIRAIAGRTRLDAGDISLFGTAVVAGSTRAELGIVPQEIALYRRLSARENLNVFGALQGLSGATLTENVDWALEHTGLSSRASDQVENYSGGMRRRLNIACGIVHRPRVVLLDEPTVGVDPQSRDRIYDMLAALTGQGVSLLLTTHHLEEAEARCNRTVIIDHGRVIAEGTLSELVEQTVGRDRLVTLRLADGSIETSRMRDVATGLPPLLERVRASGSLVDDVEVRGPSLQTVFIHLTGRDLRE